MKRLVLIGCAHSGSKASDMDAFKHYANMAKDKDTHLLVLGDLFENAIPSRGEGMVWDQNKSPDEQLDEVEDILSPVKHKIIGACTSNHSERTQKECGISLDKELYKRLGLKNGIYKGLEGVVVFEGKKIAFSHGLGHGTNEWGDARKMFAIYPQADIVAVSHRHEMATKWFGNFTLDDNGKAKEKYVLFARTGGLMGWARYAKRELYAPQKPGFTILYFKDGKVGSNTDGLQ